MRPTKLRLVVETARSPPESTPMWPAQAGAAGGVETAQPAWMKVSTYPAFMASRYDLLGGGDDDAAHAGATLRPFRTSAPGAGPPAARWCRSR